MVLEHHTYRRRHQLKVENNEIPQTHNYQRQYISVATPKTVVSEILVVSESQRMQSENTPTDIAVI